MPKKAAPDQYQHYNARLKQPARRLRTAGTKAEASLWKWGLRASQLRGYAFRRQRPVLNYIADFMCQELMLVIEVDGNTHTWEEVARRDARKQADLEAAGFRVLRFTDQEVLTQMNRVLARIEEYIDEFEASRRG
jgi:very-short-patch-repair endonuclease